MGMFEGGTASFEEKMSKSKRMPDFAFAFEFAFAFSICILHLYFVVCIFILHLYERLYLIPNESMLAGSQMGMFEGGGASFEETRSELTRKRRDKVN